MPKHRPGNGSRKPEMPAAGGNGFGFALPPGERSIRAMSNSGSPAPAGNPTVKKGAILLVDDEAPLLDLFEEALTPYFEVDRATTAREAGFLMHKKAYKVVVSDHLMPGGNGLGFLVQAREEHPATQRILVTGYMKPEMLLRSVNEAALYRYLLKPVSLAELIKTVQEAAKLHDQAVAAGT